jgi:hypothetical protein
LPKCLSQMPVGLLSVAQVFVGQIFVVQMHVG